MSNLLLLPVLVPFLAGAVLILLRNHPLIQRVSSAVIMTVMLLISIQLLYTITTGGILTVELGNWSPPFGIVLVGDMFASMMVLLTSIVGLACLFFSFQTMARIREKFFFYPFYFFLLTGVNGSFLTGDLFNLFVFFEVMLISSFILIVFGGTPYQLRESYKYVVINVFASGLFLVAIAFIYGATGTLNMAHIAVQVAEMEQQGVINVAAILLLIVFGMKGALFPLYFWLPKSYYGPPAAIAALFGGLLTKVGIYAIIRTFTLIFVHDTAFTHNIILALAGLTMFFGVLGAVSQFDFKRILSYHIISQVGYMVMGLGLFTPLALAGAIYYIAHHIIVKSALFLFAGATQKITGTTDLKKMSGLLKTHPALAWLFFISAISLAGIPPLSGFFSKFALILSGVEEGRYIIVAVSLLVGLLTLFSMMKIFIYVFWGGPSLKRSDYAHIKLLPLLAPIIPLVALTITLGLFAEPIFVFSEGVAAEILDPSIYIDAVLEE
ncbi:Na+/H+ antiporter subunit D [Alkalicoccus urumqiensis]|uniref:Na+/H+ antiporter subunit D n=1 Tax=Alkalicoccus urumqiensis TaxID=1548213 RepID=A0A2P6MFX4_ALKUR|nr:Na+/H+ antiporter subunit D [Alkalicoccus urumqiensis]PRO65151.1 Na+/H+ antiporter subunit D [Alkalicoccus urumqiensis]